MRHRRMLSVAFVALAALLLGGCYFPVNERPRYSAATPGPMPNGVSYLGTFRNEGACRSDPTYTLGVVQIPDPPSLRRVFPHMGRTPELDDVATPLILVLQDPHYPLGVLPALAASPPAPTEPPPGTVLLCVEAAGVPTNWYADVPLAGSPFEGMR